MSRPKERHTRWCLIKLALCLLQARPKEEITYNFKIKNDSKREDLIVIFVQMAHTKLNFKINDHGLEYGCNPINIKPSKLLT